MFGQDDDITREGDKLTECYDTILKESALMTTVAGFVSGFLLQISMNTPKYFALLDKVVLLVALYSITIAACLLFIITYNILTKTWRSLRQEAIHS